MTLFCLLVALPLYVFSIGPVAWATNDAEHPAYLPDAVWLLYLPLAPFTKINCIGDAFYFYTAVIWHGFPYGYTTL